MLNKLVADMEKYDILTGDITVGVGIDYLKSVIADIERFMK